MTRHSRAFAYNCDQRHTGPRARNGCQRRGIDAQRTVTFHVSVMALLNGRRVRASAGRQFGVAELLDRGARGYGAEVVGAIFMSTGISSGSPVVNTPVAQTTVGSSPAPRAVCTTSSS